jgi:hypothetical protein
MTADAGRLFVADKLVGARLDRFAGAGGGFEAQLLRTSGATEPIVGVAIGHVTGVALSYAVVQEASADTIDVLNESGVVLGRWSGGATAHGSFGVDEVHAVAVDGRDEPVSDWASGDLYVGSSRGEEEPVVDVYAPQAGGAEPAHLAARLTGTCASLGPCTESEMMMSPFVGKLEHVAVDDATGEVLVNVRSGSVSVIDLFRPGATVGSYEYAGQISEVNGAPLEFLSGLAVNDQGEVFVAREEDTGGLLLVPVVDVLRLAGSLGGLVEFSGRIAQTPSGPFRRLLGVASEPVSGFVYVADQRGETGGVARSRVDVFEPAVVPGVVSGAASGVSEFSATLNGVVKLEGTGPASCVFVWGSSPEDLSHQAVCEPGEVTGEEEAVHANIGGLVSGSEYFYRLQATRESTGATDTGEQAAPVSFVTLGPTIESESASDVASTSVTFGAVISPRGEEASVSFEYGPTTAYGTVTGVETLNGGVHQAVVSMHAQGLAPGELYHYRVVVKSALGVSAGEDQTFITQRVGEFALADNREWELVSPAAKEGTYIVPSGEPGVTQAAASGDAITYLTATPTERGLAGFQNLQQVLSTRTSAGWSTRDLGVAHPQATGQSVGRGQEYRFFSEDLSEGVLEPFGAFEPLSAQASEATTYLASDFAPGNVAAPCLPSVGQCYQPLVTGENDTASPFVPFGVANEKGTNVYSCPPAPICGPRFAGATNDANHVVMFSEVPLTSPAPATGEQGLYEWSGGVLSLVSVLGPGEEEGRPVEGQLGSGQGAGEDARGAISADGSRVFWTSAADGLYLRYNAMAAGSPVVGGRCVVVSGGCSVLVARDATFQDASADGSRVWFTDGLPLTADATEGTDLYECEIVVGVGESLECRLSDLTPVNEKEEDTLVQGDVLGVSEEGCDAGAGGECNVYFVANSVLAPGATAGDCVHGVYAPDATCNLYVVHDGQPARLVAVLSGGDEADWGRNTGGDLPQMVSRVSPDGRFVAFFSDRDLAGYDPQDAGGAGADEELYVYDAQTGRVACVSCEPSGALPSGVEVGKEGENAPLVDEGNLWEPSTRLAAAEPGWVPFSLVLARYQPRFVSDSGRVFFDGFDGLVPKDVNGTWDVYEYEPVGVGGCSSGSSSGGVVFKPEREFVVEGRGGVEGGGCVALLSSGRSAQESAFLDASGSGGDVFFLTAAQLAPQDFDNDYDVYDAHECTTVSPCLPGVAAPAPACETSDSCRAAPSPQPSIYGVPASATFSGVGNVTPAAPKALTAAQLRAQELSKALSTCKSRYKKQPSKRAKCEATAKKKFGAKAPKKASKKSKKK